MGVRRRFLVALWLVIACAYTGHAHGATIKVKTTFDETEANGKCSLREAVEAANGNVAVDTCRKGSSAKDTIELRAKRYELQIASTGEDLNADGDLDILGKVRIVGAGTTATTISQLATDRIFDVMSSNRLELSKATLVAGDVSTLPPAESRGGLARVAGPASSLKLNRAKLTLGTAQTGGAVYVGDTSALNASRTLFADNFGFTRGGAVATGEKAALKVRSSSFAGNSALSESNGVAGGAISHDALAGSASIARSDFTENKALASGAGNSTQGGAIQATGSVTIRGSTFEGNEVVAQEAGTAELGAGVYAAGSETDIVNSTFAENDAFDSHGAGGAVYAGAGAATLAHVTLAGNLANAGDSLATGALGTIQVSGSVMDTNLFAGSVCDGSVTSGAYNVVEGDDADCTFAAGDITGAGENGLGLRTLAANGGPTETFALKGASQAVNFVPTARCLALTGGKDQRGFARPVGSKCDAGSYERGAKKP